MERIATRVVIPSHYPLLKNAVSCCSSMAEADVGGRLAVPLITTSKINQRQAPALSKLAFGSFEVPCGFAACCAEGLCPSGTEPYSLTLFVLGAQAEPAPSTNMQFVSLPGKPQAFRTAGGKAALGLANLDSVGASPTPTLPVSWVDREQGHAHMPGRPGHVRRHYRRVRNRAPSGSGCRGPSSLFPRCLQMHRATSRHSRERTPLHRRWPGGSARTQSVLEQ